MYVCLYCVLSLCCNTQKMGLLLSHRCHSVFGRNLHLVQSHKNYDNCDNCCIAAVDVDDDEVGAGGSGRRNSNTCGSGACSI